MPWIDSTARVVLEPTHKANPVNAYPRTVAKNQLERLSNLGYSLLAAHEYEFYVVHKDTNKPICSDNSLRATTRKNNDTKFLYQISRQLPKVGVHVECIENEHGAGQQEIVYAPTFGIQAADNAFTFKTSVKEIAAIHNYTATFMSKPWVDQESSGCHFNHSLWDINGKSSVMEDPNNETGLSEVARHWIAGVLHHAPGLTILMSPTTNCYARYRMNPGVPINSTWGRDNRSTYVRIKCNSQTYMEARGASSASNPYLVVAGIVAAGIDGITRKLPLPEEVTGSAYNDSDLPEVGTQRIPSTMKEALDTFISDTILTEALGKEFVDHFVAMKQHEMKLKEQTVDAEWERKMYFNYI